jgi:hypothetical protein
MVVALRGGPLRRGSPDELAHDLPVACGLAFERGATRWVFRPWCGSKEARRIIPNQECPPRFHIHLVKGSVMTVIIGIDPHKALHAACAIDDNEHELAQLSVRAGQRQLEQLLCWARPLGERTWAIESAAGLGYLLAQQLVGAGECVVDVPATLSSRVRLLCSWS